LHNYCLWILQIFLMTCFYILIYFKFIKLVESISIKYRYEIFTPFPPTIKFLQMISHNVCMHACNGMLSDVNFPSNEHSDGTYIVFNSLCEHCTFCVHMLTHWNFDCTLWQRKHFLLDKKWHSDCIWLQDMLSTTC